MPTGTFDDEIRRAMEWERQGMPNPGTYVGDAPQVPIPQSRPENVPIPRDRPIPRSVTPEMWDQLSPEEQWEIMGMPNPDTYVPGPQSALPADQMPYQVAGEADVYKYGNGMGEQAGMPTPQQLQNSTADMKQADLLRKALQQMRRGRG